MTERDRRRAGLVRRLAGAPPRTVLELGAGYGATAVATAEDGYRVTGVELTDRIDFGHELVGGVAGATPTLIRGDFFAIDLRSHFDVVCYWNGFGIGSDADQRRLLRRIAGDWLGDGGVALVDVANPLVWARWDGDEERREPDPDQGYLHALGERTTYDPVGNRATDTWWDLREPDRAISQTIRCYSPADLRLLLEGTGLVLSGLVVADHDVDPAGEHPGLETLLAEDHEYLVVLRHETA